jgi:hypothetical protein
MNGQIRNQVNMRLLLFSAGIFFILGCQPLISLYDQYSYQETTSIKVDALKMISQATSSYKKHISEINAINVRIEKIYEYEKGKPSNSITTQQWEILKSPEHDLYGGYIKEWALKDSLKAAYVEDKRKQIEGSFDLIIKLETKKVKDRKIN